MPDAVRVARSDAMTGGPAGTRMVRAGAGAGVMSSPEAARRTVSVITPATVPVCTAKLDGGNTAVLDPAGTVKTTVRPPDANCTAGSSTPVSPWNVNVTVPATGTGNGL